MLFDPNRPGTEKLTATHCQSAWLKEPMRRLPAGAKKPGIQGSGLAMPGDVFMVKGWNRSTSLLMVIFACYESEALYKVRCPRACSVIFCIDALAWLSEALPPDVAQRLSQR